MSNSLNMPAVLSRFEGVQGHEPQWEAICPAHEDRTPSLAIGLRDGRVLLHCHAGCSFQDVVAKAGLTQEDLGQQQRARKTEEFYYHDAGGAHVYTVCKISNPDGTKKFWQKQADGTKSMKGVDRVPYNLPEVLKADTVFIVEGEKDVETLRRHGLVGTCNAGGAGKWARNFAQWFEGKRVIIVPDNDGPGHDHALQVKQRLGGIGQILKLPLKFSKEDISDWFAYYGGSAEKLMELANEPEIAVSTLTSEPPGQTVTDAKHAASVTIDQEFTENVFATEFIDKHESELRYVPEWKSWLVWDGKRWQLDIDATGVQKLFRPWAETVWHTTYLRLSPTADRDGLNRLRTACRRVNSDGGARAIISMARCDPRVLVGMESLNTNNDLLNVHNGTLNLSTGEFYSHRRSDMITQLANVSYDPEAKCPNWKKTIELVMDGNRELMIYLCQLLGYSFSGEVGEHILPIAYGDGNNGKSTVWNALLEIAGDYGTLAHDSLLLGDKEGHPTEKAQLYQKRIVAISEPEKGSRMRESRVKELTGDSTINARRMREDFWTFRRTHKFWMSTNHLPKVSGTDKGIWRRLKLIPFTVDISDKVEPIKDYHLILAKDEGPGILNWLLEGYQAYKQFGAFYEPDAVKQAVESYRCDQDHLGHFISDCCSVSSDAVVTAKDLYDAYREWGGKMNQTNFGREMANRFEKDKPTGGDYRRKVVYYGLTIESVTSCH